MKDREAPLQREQRGRALSTDPVLPAPRAFPPEQPHLPSLGNRHGTCHRERNSRRPLTPESHACQHVPSDAEGTRQAVPTGHHARHCHGKRAVTGGGLLFPQTPLRGPREASPPVWHTHPAADRLTASAFLIGCTAFTGDPGAAGGARLQRLIKKEFPQE